MIPLNEKSVLKTEPWYELKVWTVYILLDLICRLQSHIWNVRKFQTVPVSKHHSPCPICNHSLYIGHWFSKSSSSGFAWCTAIILSFKFQWFGSQDLVYFSWAKKKNTVIILIFQSFLMLIYMSKQFLALGGCSGLSAECDYLHLWPPSRMTTITYYHWTSYLDWERMTH